MNRVYLHDSYAREIGTYVESISVMRKCTALVTTDLIFHPKGGGQPDDHGAILIGECSYPIRGLVKQGRDVWTILGSKLPAHDEIMCGQSVSCVLDWQRRYCFMRYHTAAHLIMAAARRIWRDYIPKGIDICDDGKFCTVKFSKAGVASDDQVNDLRGLVAAYVASGASVRYITFSDISEAAKELGDKLRVDPDLTFRGPVRVIVIDGIDANPCGGTHVASLNEIGLIDLLSVSGREDGSDVTITFNLD